MGKCSLYNYINQVLSFIPLKIENILATPQKVFTFIAFVDMSLIRDIIFRRTQTIKIIKKNLNLSRSSVELNLIGLCQLCKKSILPF